MNILDSILKFFDWVQQKVKTKSGIFVLGALVGGAAPATVSYVLYKDGQMKDQRLVDVNSRISAIELEKDKWQERAFNAESTCLEKVREMMSFFGDLEGLYKKEEVQNRKNIQGDEAKLEQYKDITDKLNSLKNDLENEK